MMRTRARQEPEKLSAVGRTPTCTVEAAGLRAADWWLDALRVVREGHVDRAASAEGATSTRNPRAAQVTGRLSS